MKKLLLILAALVVAIPLLVAVGCNSDEGNANSMPKAGDFAVPAPLGEEDRVNQAMSPNNSQQPTGVWVSGEGKVSAVPDIAVLSLGVEAQEMTVAGMKLRRGRYHFTPTAQTPPGVRNPIRMDVQGLLMEAARRVDEEQILREALPSQAITFSQGAKTLPADKPIVFVCGTGARSGESYYMVQDVRPELKNVYYLEGYLTFKKDGTFEVTKEPTS